MKKGYKRALSIVILCIICVSIGVFGGIEYYKRDLAGSAIVLWMTGVDSLKKGEHDDALFYFSQSIALKNDDPMFFHSVDEAYEAKNNTEMALKFYSIALEKYRKEKTGPRQKLEEKIRTLKSQNG
jgi:tetratricopeptide (TPR) repeat protein